MEMTERSDLIREALEGTSQWVYFEINRGWYALPVGQVRELIQTPTLVKVPKVPDYILGVITLREVTLPVIDLRLRLGLPSAAAEREEMSQLMKQRKQDHLDWLEALKAHVNHGDPFTKALDPHACAFGKWYDTYKTEDLALTAIMRKFDEPHKAIHSIGEKVIGLKKSGDEEGASRIIARTEDTDLHDMLLLFDQVVEHLRRQESQVTVVTELSHGICGLLVDKVESVLTLDKSEIGPKPAMSSGGKKTSEMVVGVARPKTFKDRMILLLDPDRGLGGKP